MTLAQHEVLNAIRKTWGTTDAYGIDPVEGAILIVAHAEDGPFAIVEHDGYRENVTDIGNRCHWLNDVHNGRFPKVA